MNHWKYISYLEISPHIKEYNQSLILRWPSKPYITDNWQGQREWRGGWVNKVGTMWETSGDRVSSYCYAYTSLKYWTFCITAYKNVLLLAYIEELLIYNYSGFSLAGYFRVTCHSYSLCFIQLLTFLAHQILTTTRGTPNISRMPLGNGNVAENHCFSKLKSRKYLICHGNNDIK